MTAHQIVEKLIGSIDPVGETQTDSLRFENLKAMSKLMYSIGQEISYVARYNKDRHEDSMKKAGKYADRALNDMIEEFGLNDASFLEETQKTSVLLEACENTARGQMQHPTLQSYVNHSIAVCKTAIAKVKGESK